ncbi:FecR family protein [Pedobacter sp. GR22-6]|uniref:FecR family protein n=1 Tax=Pedobacter sp. GR22-6 TaxID=3127957 RepID=UPI00307F531C
MEDYRYQLIVAYFEKTITDDELTELQIWLEQHADHQEQFRETMQILEASRLYFKTTRPAAASWNTINAHIQKEMPQKPERKLNWLAYAATLLMVSGSAIWWLVHQSVKPMEPITYSVISNPEGRQSKILLPDSSVVYLAGGSKIRYAKNFRGKQRTVSLNGEAFFDVRHRKRPFVIKSGEITTVVLGTSFNVKAFRADHKVTVTVNTGKVGVMSTIGGKKTLLKYLLPNQQLEVNAINGRYVFTEANAHHVSAWIKNHFVFDNTPLYEVLATLEHRYGVNITLMDKEVGNERITAKFRNLPFKQVMQELVILSRLNYQEKDGQFFMYESNSK